MTHSLRRRAIAAGLISLTIAMVAPAIAHADPPANDDLDNAIPITALPFHASVNTAEATIAADEPSVCQAFSTNTVWFDYTPARDEIVNVTVTGTGFAPGITAVTGPRDQLVAVPGFCALGGQTATDTLRGTAGTTYHLQAMSPFGGGGPLTIDVVPVSPAPNDDFAAAEPLVGVPPTLFGDLTRAGPEPGEPAPSCADDSPQSVWFTYTPASTKTVAIGRPSPFDVTVTAYRGDSLTNLTEAACGNGGVIMPVTGGQTYHLRVASDGTHAGVFDFIIQTAPRISPGLDVFSRQGNSIFADVEFFSFSGDPLGEPIARGTVNFGDGASASIIGNQGIGHRYTTDGTYQASISASTPDGRTGTGALTVTVKTEDVGLTAFDVPTLARAGQTKPISVTVANTRYDEKVQVELLKQTGSSFTRIGVLTQTVPARADRTVTFPFAYTYSSADATAERVTFKAVATLVPNFPGDANPTNNELLGSTTVR
jgi:hypothetical protein